MKISDYKSLIRKLPELQQSFDVKQSIWKVGHQQKKIDQLFEEQQIENGLLRVSRQDVFNSIDDLDFFILNTLMWGYPTKGRGKNVDRLLEKENLEKLKAVLTKYKSEDVLVKLLIEDTKNIGGLGLSTLTKFLYFLSVDVEGQPSLILDNQIINVINSNRFEELTPLKGIRYETGLKKYGDYLKAMNEIADNLNVQPGKLEYFLFTFGNQLK